MRFLVIGLGSMGKRRVRNLKALGFSDIAGFDHRDDRRQESLGKYAIEVYDDFELANQTFEPDVYIISTSPEYHMVYANEGYERGISCFVEASVVEAEAMRQLDFKSRNSPVKIYPSCTMRYFPGPKKIKEIIQDGLIGKVLNINYQTGQYLPDWHPWEKIEDFYVSKKETGACREIVPFELTWINDIFGYPEPVSLFKEKLTDLNADIDDIYHFILRYPNSVIANITIEVISRPSATREMRILGSEGEVVFSADSKMVRYINTGMDKWVSFDLQTGSVENGYINPEEPYISEMQDFVNAVANKNPSLFPNTLSEDYGVLQILYQLEALSGK